MGSPKTPEHRAKIAAALKGRKHSPEAIAKIAEAARQRWTDETQRQRQSAIKMNVTKVPDEEWTPAHSRSAVHNRVNRGIMPPARHCAIDPSHGGPFHYDHCGDPPYAKENRFVVQPLCVPCHVAISAERRGLDGYTNRRVATKRTCAHCGTAFVVASAARVKQATVYCCREHYLLSICSSR